MNAIAAVIDGPAQVPHNASNLPTACALCSHNCGLRVDVKDNRIVDVRGDESHPSSKGYTCNKGYAIAQYVEHAQRVQQPLKRREDGTFERISWQQAIAEIAAKLNVIRTQYAPRAIAAAGMGGQGGHSQSFGLIPFMFGIGSPMVFTALSQEKTQHALIDRRLIRATHDIYLQADEHHATFMLLIGSNPLISNRGINATETLKELYRDPQRRMVVVDPRITETTRKAHRHLRIQPAKDVFLLLALAGVIVQENLHDSAFLAAKTQGSDQVLAQLRSVDVAEMARRCGLHEDDIRATAREFATTKPACISYDLGIEHSSHNTLTSYLIRVLLFITGNFGRKGGNTYQQLLGPKMPFIKTLPKALASELHAIPFVTPIPQFPVSIIPEEIESTHPDRLRALICDGANPMSSYPDTQRFRAALAKLDLLVVIDPAMSETARLAHYVLPAPTAYEKWEFSIFPKEIIAPQLRPPVVSGPPEALPEIEIYHRLALAMGLVTPAPAVLHRLAKHARKPWGTPVYLAALNTMAAAKFGGVQATLCRSAFWTYETFGPTLPNPALAVLWLFVLGYATTRRDQIERALPETSAMRNPFALTEYLFAKLLAHPEGVKLGEYEPDKNLEYNCGYKDGKARLFQADFARDLAALIARDPEPHDEEFPFILNGGLRTGFTANTIMQDPSWRKGKGPHAALYMAREDAERLALNAGDRVHIYSRRGVVTAPVKIDAGTLPGHLHLPNMLNQQYPDPQTGALVQTGISINELVDINDRDPYTGCPHTKRIRCRLEKTA
jgi:anaerobic selenocysteine-containing dehydrogenase